MQMQKSARKNKFEDGDIIDYGFFKDLKVIKRGRSYYTLEDSSGNKKRVYKRLVDKYGIKKCQ